ncbi:Universal stress protein family protein [Paraburkholderia lycopersici]|uniref:Universal stress protein family protein n=2 Tax=Paraburkholderia lycopersici TaxID=416944 RepID=A0A1G6SGL5_9BURK|nr:Universal stress protein family protein [Paraburkholderia lycopersici]
MQHVAPYSRLYVLFTGMERVAALLDCVAGWAERGAHVRLAGLAPAASLADTDQRAAQHFSNRITLAATLDASRELLALRGIEADCEFLGTGPDSAARTEALARAVRDWKADLTIGAPANPVALAGETDCPVLLLPTPTARYCSVPPRRIFVASDGSAASACAVREAARLAAPGTAVRVGYLACDPAAAQHPEDFDAAILEAEHDGEPAAHAIIQAALQWRADLLVLGTRGGHEGGRWRYASVAADVAQQTVLPLLLVPQASGASILT